MPFTTIPLPICFAIAFQIAKRTLVKLPGRLVFGPIVRWLVMR